MSIGGLAVGKVGLGQITQTWDARLTCLDGGPVAEDVWKGVKQALPLHKGARGARSEAGVVTGESSEGPRRREGPWTREQWGDPETGLRATGSRATRR